MFKSRKRHGSSGRGSRTDIKARSKQGNGHCLSCSFVSFNICFVLKMNIHYNINFSVLLDLWLLDNTYDALERSERVITLVRKVLPIPLTLSLMSLSKQQLLVLTWVR